MAVYLDHNATTPVDERVLEAMLPLLQAQFGNPSSRHRFGRLARTVLDQAREQVAALVGAQAGQVVFTSGGTESNQLALLGSLGSSVLGEQPGRLACSAVEHPSLMAAAATLQRQGWALDRLAVDARGGLQLPPQGLHQQTRLVSVMWANNETGVVQDLAPVVAAAQRVGALLHSDVVQAAGKLPIDFASSGVQLMSLSAHKLYGPKGVGALIRDRAVDLTAVMAGGGQEDGLRGGTGNLPGIAGFGRAAELALAEMTQRRQHLLALRDELDSGIAALTGAVRFAADAQRLPNTLMFALQGVEGETLLMELDRRGLAVSSGSACSAGSTDPSHVLTAMGVAPDLARHAIRVSLGKDNSRADVQRLLQLLGELTVRFGRMARAF